MNFDEKTRLDNESTYDLTEKTELDNGYTTNYEDIANNDNVVEPVQKSGGKWKAVTIGSTVGILMGAAGAFAGNEVINGSGSVLRFTDDDTNAVADEAKDEAETEAGIEEVIVADDAAIDVATEELSATEELPVSEDALIEEPILETEVLPVAEPVFEPVYVTTAVNDDMSFEDAFAVAREEVGPGGLFVWQGNVYNTYYAEEWNAMSPESQDAFVDTASNVNIPLYNNVNDDYFAYEPDTAQDIMVAPEADDDVRIIGVYEENIDGQNMYIGELEMDGENVVLVDGDQDGLFDVLIADMDGDGMIADNEFVDISSDGIMVSDLANGAIISDSESLVSNDGVNDYTGSPADYEAPDHSDMPDYMNDADVSMC